jgi:hypothetical protein
MKRYTPTDYYLDLLAQEVYLTLRFVYFTIALELSRVKVCFLLTAIFLMRVWLITWDHAIYKLRRYTRWLYFYWLYRHIFIGRDWPRIKRYYRIKLVRKYLRSYAKSLTF